MTSSLSSSNRIRETAPPLASSPQRLARIAGILYLLIAAAAIFSVMVVSSQLIVPGDAAASAANITASPGLFRAGLAGLTLIVVTEIALTALLYALLRPVSRTLSLAAALFRLAMTVVHAVVLVAQFSVLPLLGEAGYLAAFEPEQLHALVALLLGGYDIGWSIGIVVFSFHTLLLGVLVYRSGYLPKALGVLLLVAFVGYLGDGLAALFLSGYGQTPVFLVIPIFLAEIAFPLWLLIRGVNVERWGRQDTTSAALR